MSDTIRTVHLGDAGTLAEIYAHYVANTEITFEIEVPSVDEFAGRIGATVLQFPYLVFERDGRILGYAYAGRYRTRAAYDWTLESTVYLREGFFHAYPVAVQR